MDTNQGPAMIPQGGFPPMGNFAPQSEGTNLFSVLINIAFGFVLGLMFFFGPKEVIAYGSKLASDILKATGQGQQMSAFGFAATAAPYIILAPLGGLVVKQLTAVRTFRSFLYFAAAVVAGLAAAYFSQGYFETVIS